MKKIGLAILLLLFRPNCRSQEQTPQLLVQAVHCLASKNFLPPSKEAVLSFGYLLDETSYPGDKVLYIVNFPHTTRTRGLVFTVLLTKQNSTPVFNIQNNASFALSRDGLHRVSFTSPPLGGTWTQEHLALAISKIENQPRVTIRVEKITAADPLTRCESYTDHQP